MRRPALAPLALLACALAHLAGCAASRTGAPADAATAPIAGAPHDPATFTVPAGRYAHAFDAARDTLRERGYTLERVDARAGVITTRPRTEPALAGAPAGAGSSWLNAQRSLARVEFSPIPDSPPAPGEDLRAADTPLHARVVVVVERLQRPGRRIESTSIQLSTRWREPDWSERGMHPAHTTVEYRDTPAAVDLVNTIKDRTNKNAR